MSPPTAPALDSTDLPLDEPEDETLDTEMPPSAPAPLNLTPEQADDAGIIDPQPGDTFTLKVTISSTGEGIAGSILPGSAIKDEAPSQAPADRKGLQRIKGPTDMGFGDETDEFTGF